MVAGAGGCGPRGVLARSRIVFEVIMGLIESTEEPKLDSAFAFKNRERLVLQAPNRRQGRLSLEGQS